MGIRIFICLLVGLASGLARAGTETHGGDAVVQDFTRYGQDFLKLLPYLQTSRLTAPQTAALKHAIEHAVIRSKQFIFLKRHEMDAVNRPRTLSIDVNRRRWLVKSPETARLHRDLALHEYLWIAGVEDTDYVVSNPLIDDFNLARTRWIKTPVAQALTEALCTGIISRDHVTINQALELGADLDLACGQPTYVCPTGEGQQYFTFDYGPVGLAIRNLGSYNLCKFPLAEDPDQDTEMLAILNQLLAYHPDLRRVTAADNWDDNDRAANRFAFRALDALVNAGSNPLTVVFNANGGDLEQTLKAMPEYLLEDTVKAGLDVNGPVAGEPAWTISSVLVTGRFCLAETTSNPSTNYCKTEFIDFLVNNHKIDFCKVAPTPYLQNPIFEPVGQMVNDVYLPLARKYGGPCVR